LTWVKRLGAPRTDDGVAPASRWPQRGAAPVLEEALMREFLAAAAISAVIIGLMLGVA
jgi:hypothetical protein